MNSFISSAEKLFRYYKQLAEKAMSQLTEEQIFSRPTVHENSIAIIVQHMSGNMLSRWTDIFKTDGEKEWRNRDQEFEDNFKTKTGLLNYWEEGWYTLFTTLEKLTYEDLERVIYIRSMGHTVTEALTRQLCHYAYHVGQIILLSKQSKKSAWKYLSIAPGESVAYNENKNKDGRRQIHFADDL